MRSEVLNNVQLFNTRLSQMPEPEDIKSWVTNELAAMRLEFKAQINEGMSKLEKDLSKKTDYLRPSRCLLNFDNDDRQ